jgi:aspartyl-tRNA(Asn)/glutamyl-tRNA(Gln) amidotransferase subunit B
MDTIIGLEVHAQLNLLRSKLFCSCSTRYHGSPPNTHVCPVCLGLPGALPKINRRAVESAIKVALVLGCRILDQTIFYRKNYFYPDLPRGFQISQYDFPLAVDGKLLVETEDGEKEIGIKRVHLEEDPGKLVYRGPIDLATYSLIDYNRSGIPLLEIVTEPDMRSPKEARRFLSKLRTILEYLEVFDGNLEGAMRVDANISIAGKPRVEVKNISSYKGVQRALSFEITRQKNLLRRTGKIFQETRHYDEARGITISLRAKETEEDYRYFPEPDLVPLRIKEWIPKIKLPELPDAKRNRFVSEYGISEYHAKVLTSELKLANFFEKVASKVEPVVAATWIADILKGELNYRDEHFVVVRMIAENPSIIQKNLFQIRVLPDIGMKFRPDILAKSEGREILIEVETEGITRDSLPQIKKRISEVEKKYPELHAIIAAPFVEGKLDGIEWVQIDVESLSRGKIYDVESISPEHFIEILEFLKSGKITEKGAVEIIRTLLDEGGNPGEIIERKKLGKVSGEEVRLLVQEVIKEFKRAVDDYRGGKKEALNFLVGQVMRKTKGRADAPEVRKIFEDKIK